MPSFPPDLAGRRSEQGVTLIELLVALLVLGVVMSGVVSIVLSTLRVSVINDARSVATNLAQAEIERVRALGFEELAVGGRTERQVAADGEVFDVARDASWVELDADTDLCAEPEASTETAVVRIDVEVTPRSDTSQTVRSTTTLARPPVTPADDVGAISVRVVDHQDPPVAVPAVRVRVTGPKPASGEARIQQTTAGGCALFTDLPAGEYDVDLHRPGYVSLTGAPEPVRSAGVGVGARTALEIGYAPAGGVLLEATSRPGAVGALPTTLPITVARDERVTVLGRGQVLEPLFPGAVELWAGSCDAADPLGVDPNGDPYWPGASRAGRVTVPAAATGTAVAELAVVRLEVPASVSDPGAPEPVTVTAVPLDACEGGAGPLGYGPLLPVPEAGDPLPLVSFLDLAVPYGRWQLTAEGPDGVTAVRTATVDPRSVGTIAVEEASGGAPRAAEGTVGGGS